MINPGRGYRNEFRIIAGRWRRRRFQFANLPGIRPSPDRVRETLFNWLMHEVPGARCLDLFAGSGALGLEALSRGAQQVTFVDRDWQVNATLRGHLVSLQAANAEVLQLDALAFLRGPARAFDIVFLDPPFASPLLQESLATLNCDRWLMPGAGIYMEYRLGGAPVLPAGLQVTREAHAGRVGFALVRCASVQLAEG